LQLEVCTTCYQNRIYYVKGQIAFGILSLFKKKKPKHKSMNDVLDRFATNWNTGSNTIVRGFYDN